MPVAIGSRYGRRRGPRTTACVRGSARWQRGEQRQRHLAVEMRRNRHTAGFGDVPALRNSVGPPIRCRSGISTSADRACSMRGCRDGCIPSRRARSACRAPRRSAASPSWSWQMTGSSNQVRFSVFHHAGRCGLPARRSSAGWRPPSRRCRGRSPRARRGRARLMASGSPGPTPRLHAAEAAFHE